MNNTLDEIREVTAAFGKQKPIQKQNVLLSKPQWTDDPEPTWSWDTYKYRVKPIEAPEPRTIWGVVPKGSSGELNTFTPHPDHLSAVTFCRKYKDKEVVQMIEVTKKSESKPDELQLTSEAPAPNGGKPIGRAGVGNVKSENAGGRWSKDDDAYIIQWHNSASNSMIGKFLGRSPKSITNRKSKLKLAGKL